jgi:hypothetical protein
MTGAVARALAERARQRRVRVFIVLLRLQTQEVRPGKKREEPRKAPNAELAALTILFDGALTETV